MPDLETMMIRLGVTGDTDAKRRVHDVGNAVSSSGESAEEAARSFRQFRLPLVEAAEAARMCAGAVMELVVGISEFLGVGLAAKYQRIEFAFEGLLGSAEKAKKLMEDLRTLGETTPFRTDQLVEFSTKLLETGSSAAQVSDQMRVLAHVPGLTDSGLGQLTSQMAEMRLRPRIETRELAALGINIQAAVEAGTGQKFGTQAGASRYLASLTGERAFEVLMTGLDKEFGKIDVSTGTFLGLMENLAEAVEEIALPTGRLLIGVIAPIAKFVEDVAKALGGLNEMTGGIAGLAVMLYGLNRAWGFVVGTIDAAKGAIMKLTVAMEEMAAAARDAAEATTVSAGAQARGAEVTAVAAGVTGGTALAAAGGLSGLGGKAMGLIKSPIGMAIAADIAGSFAGNFIENHIAGKTGHEAGESVKTITSFGATGAVIGSLIPGLGTAIGTAIGVAVGSAKAFMDVRGEEHETAENTKKSADALQDIRAQMIGGGARGRRVLGDLEMEYALARMIQTGVG